MRSVLVVCALVLGACGRGATTSRPTAPLVVGAGHAATSLDDLEAPRARVLEAMDRGDLAEATRALAPMAERQDLPGAKAIAQALKSPGLFANVAPIRIALPPPPVTTSAPPLPLVVKRVKSPQGVRDGVERAVRGEYLSSGRGDPDTDAVARAPTFAPPRLGEIPIRRYRATDGRWFAAYVDRFVAIANGDGALVQLLDFGAWPPSMHGGAVESGELRGNVLYFVANTPNGGFIGALDVGDGRILWRSAEAPFHESFAVGTEHVVASTLGSPGELVVFDRATGAVRARRPLPEIHGEALLTTEDGMIVAYATSHTMGGTDLEHDERLEIRLPASKPAAAPPMPKAPAPVVRAQPITAKPDPRLAAWNKLDREHDPRAAVLALRSVLDAHPTNLAGAVLASASRVALDEARKKATETLEALKPFKIATGVQTARRAPIARPRVRSLHVTARKAISPDTFLAELPKVDDSALLPPAAVPETLGGRRRDVDAGSIEGARRVEVYRSPYKTTWILVWDSDRLVAFFESETEVRFATVSGDVLFLATLGSQPFVLEARDLATGDLYYQTPGINDQELLVQDGYIVACARDGSGVLLIEADTGRIAGRVSEPSDMPWLIFRKDGGIVAATTSVVLQLALVDAPPGGR